MEASESAGWPWSNAGDAGGKKEVMMNLKMMAAMIVGMMIMLPNVADD
jgi:hypothetical protein